MGRRFRIWNPKIFNEYLGRAKSYMDKRRKIKYNKIKDKIVTKIVSHKNVLKNSHTPVLYEKVLENLNIRDGLTYVDGTFGAGGHTNMILSSANCNVISIDRDPSVEIFKKKIKNKFPNIFK